VSYRISLVSLTPFWDREGDIFSPSHNCGYERGGLSVGEVSLQVGGTGVDGSRVDQGARPWPMGGYRSRRAGSSRTAATAELPRSQPHLATRAYQPDLHGLRSRQPPLRSRPYRRLSGALPVYAAPDQDVCGVDM